MKHRYLAWAEIDLKNIRHNLREIKKIAIGSLIRRPVFPRRPFKRTGKPDVLCVVKADAYGHGMIAVARALNKMGVNFWGVADVGEGIALRKAGFKQPVLLLGTPLPFQAKEVVDFNLTPTVCTMTLASALNRYAKKKRRRVDIHIKVDTGMGRLGVGHADAGMFIERVARLRHLDIKGLFTHFPLADTNAGFTRKQIRMLDDLVDELDGRGLVIPYIHAANSMGLARYRAKYFNLVRPGLMLYGQYPSAALKGKINLKPAMSVKARIIYVKKIPKGQGVSYGHTFKAPRAMTVATLPIGYNDGYFRSLSNKTRVLVNGRRCPVIGRVTMDQIMIDVFAVPSVKIGQEVTLLGRRQEVAADELARLAGTISYEILCSLGNRLPRVYRG